jgi:hypothetical protein
LKEIPGLIQIIPKVSSPLTQPSAMANPRFVLIDKLVADSFKDVRRWRDENSND